MHITESDGELSDDAEDLVLTEWSLLLLADRDARTQITVVSKVSDDAQEPMHQECLLETDDERMIQRPQQLIRYTNIRRRKLCIGNSTYTNFIDRSLPLPRVQLRDVHRLHHTPDHQRLRKVLIRLSPM